MATLSQLQSSWICFTQGSRGSKYTEYTVGQVTYFQVHLVEFNGIKIPENYVTWSFYAKLPHVGMHKGVEQLVLSFCLSVSLVKNF